MTYLFNYIAEAVREKLNWIQQVRNAMTEVNKVSKGSKSSSSKSSTSKVKVRNNKKNHPVSPTELKSNLNSSGKTVKNKIFSQKNKGVKNDRISTSPQ